MNAQYFVAQNITPILVVWTSLKQFQVAVVPVEHSRRKKAWGKKPTPMALVHGRHKQQNGVAEWKAWWLLLDSSYYNSPNTIGFPALKNMMWDPCQ